MKNGNGKWIEYELDWSKEEKVIIRLNSCINYIQIIVQIDWDVFHMRYLKIEDGVDLYEYK